MSETKFRPLGELEQAIMDLLWGADAPASVKDVEALLAHRGSAYTTLMTTLDRLHKKGMVEREKKGHAFMYRPAVARQTFERRMVANLIGDLPTASTEAVLSGFLDAAGSTPETLDALARMIAERKRDGETD